MAYSENAIAIVENIQFAILGKSGSWQQNSYTERYEKIGEGLLYSVESHHACVASREGEIDAFGRIHIYNNVIIRSI